MKILRQQITVCEQRSRGLILFVAKPCTHVADLKKMRHFNQCSADLMYVLTCQNLLRQNFLKQNEKCSRRSVNAANEMKNRCPMQHGVLPEEFLKFLPSSSNQSAVHGYDQTTIFQVYQKLIRDPPGRRLLQSVIR